MSNLKTAFIIIFTTLLGAFFLWTSLSRPSILIIHGQGPEHPSSIQVNQGIQQVFKDKTYYHTYYHYIDIKNSIAGTAKVNKKQKALEVIKAVKPEFLILVGDIAQSYVGPQYLDDPTIKIIYTNIDQFPNDYGYNTVSNVTGSRAILPLSIFNDLITDQVTMNRMKGPVHVYLIGDISPESRERSEQLQTYDGWTHAIIKKPVFCATFEDWKREIETFKDPNGILIITAIDQITIDSKSEKIIPAKELIQWTAHNVKMPYIGTSNQIVSNGGAFAIASSAKEQGVKAAKIVEDLIENDIYINEIPGDVSDNFVVYLRRHHSDIQAKLYIAPVYKAFAKAMNQYYE